MTRIKTPPIADRIGTLTATLHWLEHPAVHDAFRAGPAQYRWLENCIVRLLELIETEKETKR